MKSTNQKKIFRSEEEGTKKLTKSAQRKLTVTCIGIIAIALILLGAGLTLSQKNHTEESAISFEEMQNSISGQMKNEMAEATAYLEKLDGSIVENQKKLEEVNEQLIERQKSLVEVESTQKKLDENTTDVSLKVQELEKKTETQVHTLQKNMDAVHEDIQTTMEKISAIITSLEENRVQHNADQEQSMSKINEVNASVKEVNQSVRDVETKLSKSYDNLKALIKELQTEKTENQGEIERRLAEVEQSLKLILEADMRQITEAFDKLTSDFELQLARLGQVLDGRLEELDQNMSGSFENLGQNMSGGFESLGQNMNGQFSSLDQDLRDSFSGLDQSVNGNFAEFSQELGKTLTSLDEKMGGRFEVLDRDMADKFQAMNQTLIQHITELNVSSGQENEDLKTYLQSLQDSLRQDLNQVFTYVSNGKKKLASALLTKGVGTEADATFEQIRDAILSIDQNIVIGVQEIPGTITYQYHYHQDASGENPHTDSSQVQGGCYTIPEGHAHSEECYRVENYHVHTSQCPKKSIWVDWVENPYWGAEYTCGNVPQNASKNVLVCTKTETDVDSYLPSCGLVDGQIIGAQIVYDRNAVEATAAAAIINAAEATITQQPDEQETELPPRASEDLIKETESGRQEGEEETAQPEEKTEENEAEFPESDETMTPEETEDSD
ncbi:MAG: hypothetical protein Q4C58_03665 [Eubacteriales bacterium]|nr:hypothetical protein [Eubacteriales bacterium]